MRSGRKKLLQGWREGWCRRVFFFIVAVEMQNLETGDFQRRNRSYPDVTSFQGLAQIKLQFPGKESEFFPHFKRHLGLKKHICNINSQTETFKQYQFSRGISSCSFWRNFSQTLSKSSHHNHDGTKVPERADAQWWRNRWPHLWTTRTSSTSRQWTSPWTW